MGKMQNGGEQRSAVTELTLHEPTPVIEGVIRSRRQTFQFQSSHRHAYETKFQHITVDKSVYSGPMTTKAVDELNNMYTRVNGVIMDTNVDVCLVHICTKKGIKKHGYTAIGVILAEFIQIDNKKAVEPIGPANLSSEKRKKSLQAITLVTEARYGGSMVGHTPTVGNNKNMSQWRNYPLLLYQQRP